MKTMIKILTKKRFRNPMLIEGLPGIGNVGRVAAGYLVNELGMKKLAELYSPHFLPLVIIHDDSVAQILKCEFYYKRTKKRDIIIITGDTQSIDPEGHYEVVNIILDFAEQIGVKEIITLGGFAEGCDIDEPRVIGAVNDKKLIKKYEKYDIDFGKEHKIGTIVGASGLLLGLGKARNIPGLCLMGETIGLPLMTDPKAAESVLHTLSKALNIKISMTRLEKTIKDMEQKINKTEKIHKKVLSELSKSKGEEIRYIG